jgi:signal transduction histidine kinase
MSFRSRLILAFAALAMVQAALFTLLSDRLLKDALVGEADARLVLLGTFFEGSLPASLWPPKAALPPEGDAEMISRLDRFCADYSLDRATLMRGDDDIWDSRSPARRSLPVSQVWLDDGMKKPEMSGQAHLSGPLYDSEHGWHKTLYYRMRQGDAWLRLEAGTPYLGRVAALKTRLLRLALALVLPSLAIGLILAFALSRRSRQLVDKLRAAHGPGLRLEGRDEFAGIAASMDSLLKNLDSERNQREDLLQGRIRQARHLAFGVAHELRNPLAGMSLTVEILGRKAAEGAPAAELESVAARIRSEAARVEQTVARFLDFARTPVLRPEPLDLCLCAADAMRGVLPHPELSGQAMALADRQACALVLGILLSNAAESAGEAGRISVALKDASLTVWDSGPPIEVSERGRLFTPFFTTKPKGMGLGLATAYGLADAMGGRLSLLDDGKSFELRLPPP